MTTTFEDARVGDRVWSIEYGWGSVVRIERSEKYPIKVDFAATPQSFNDSGVCSAFSNQTLFWDEIKITAPPMPERVRYKNVNGFKVPDASFAPVCHELYIMPAPSRILLFEADKAGAGEVYATQIDRGLCYPHTPAGKQAAIAHARAWLGEGEPWTD